jgi:hypothetical protein
MTFNAPENIYTIHASDGDVEYRVEVTRGKYNPVRRATMHNVHVFLPEGRYPIARGQTTSARESYTTTKAIEILEKQAGVIL